jgi:hypothetical protein
MYFLNGEMSIHMYPYHDIAYDFLPKTSYGKLGDVMERYDLLGHDDIVICGNGS